MELHRIRFFFFFNGGAFIYEVAAFISTHVSPTAELCCECLCDRKYLVRPKIKEQPSLSWSPPCAASWDAEMPWQMCSVPGNRSRALLCWD